MKMNRNWKKKKKKDWKREGEKIEKRGRNMRNVMKKKV